MLGDWFVFSLNVDWNLLLSLLARLGLAILLSGLIGFEREHSGRPAGFRTHILVGVGSCLVMLTSEFIFMKYSGPTNLDPARLGAQVISGVGFLGAGTIIRDGNTVKGLTTAASLWAVSCIGLASGIGFYSGAMIGTAATLATLMIFKKFEFASVRKYQHEPNSLVVDLRSDNHDILKIVQLIESLHASVKSIQMLDSEDPSLVRIEILLDDLSLLRKAEIVQHLLEQKAIRRMVSL